MPSLTLAGESVSVRAARRFVHDLLDANGIDPHAATLLASELASNVVQHACTDFDVVVTLGDAVVRVEIHDGIAISETFRDLINSPPTAVPTNSPRGRGLLLIRSCAARFGLTDKGLHGKAIWFEIQRLPSNQVTT